MRFVQVVDVQWLFGVPQLRKSAHRLDIGVHIVDLRDIDRAPVFSHR